MTARAVAKTITAAGLALIAAACVLVIARDGGSIFGKPLDGREIWLLCAFAFAGLVGFALAVRGGAWSGLLCALLFAGGAAQLWLTDPDWFPSIRVRPTSTLHSVMLAVVAMQGAGALGALMWFYRGAWRRTLAQKRAPVSREQARRGIDPGLLALCIAASSAFCVSIVQFAAPFEPVAFGANLVVGAAAVAIFLLNAVALASAPDLPRLNRVLESRYAPLAAAGFAFTLAALLAHFAFGGAALVQDEAAYMFQARTFAQGAVFAPPPATDAPGAFDHYLLAMDGGRWFAVTAPGFSAALAAATLIGAPWLLNPLLGAIAVLLTYQLAARFLDQPLARLSAVLAAASPWLLFTSASLMTHALGLALALGAAALSLGGKTPDNPRRQSHLRLLAAGLLMGWLFVTRSLDGVLLGGALGLFILVRHWRTAPLAVLAYGVGCIASGLCLFAFNASLTGEPLRAPQADYIDQLWGPGTNKYGFGPEPGPPLGWDSLDLAPGHSPLEAVAITQNSLTALSFDLFGWTAGSLALFFAWIIWGRRRGAPLAMAAILALIVGAHFFYWFGGAYYIGPRYWYGAFFPLIFLSVAGVDALARRAQERLSAGASDAIAPDGAGRAAFEPARERVITTVLILACFGATIFVGWRAVEKYMARSEDGRRIAAIARSPDYADALVISRDKRLAEDAMIFNDPFQRDGAPLFAFARDDAAEAMLREAYPDRRVVMLERGD